MTKRGTVKLSAVKLRTILLVSIVLLLGLSSAAFWLFCNQMINYTNEVQKAKTAATISTNDIQRLKQLEQQMKNDEAAVERTKSIVADSKYYQYQDQIIADITSYAKASKLSITSISFDSATSGQTTSAAGDQAAASTPTTVTPTGLKSTSASVTIKNPVDYTALMRFVYAIEQNLTKMQISGLSLQRDTEGGDINVNPITVEVYTR